MVSSIADSTGSTSSAWTGFTEEHVSAEGEDETSEMHSNQGPRSVFQLQVLPVMKHTGINTDSLSD